MTRQTAIELLELFLHGSRITPDPNAVTVDRVNGMLIEATQDIEAVIRLEKGFTIDAEVAAVAKANLTKISDSCLALRREAIRVGLLL